MNLRKDHSCEIVLNICIVVCVIVSGTDYMVYAFLNNEDNKLNIIIDWTVYIYCCIHLKHVANDVLVRSSMKSATSCVKQRELYDSVSREKHEHKLYSRVAPSVCMFQCRLHYTWQCCCSDVIYVPMCGLSLPL